MYRTIYERDPKFLAIIVTFANRTVILGTKKAIYGTYMIIFETNMVILGTYAIILGPIQSYWVQICYYWVNIQSTKASPFLFKSGQNTGITRIGRTISPPLFWAVTEHFYS